MQDSAVWVGVGVGVRDQRLAVMPSSACPHLVCSDFEVHTPFNSSHRLHSIHFIMPKAQSCRLSHGFVPHNPHPFIGKGRHWVNPLSVLPPSCLESLSVTSSSISSSSFPARFLRLEGDPETTTSTNQTETWGYIYICID